MSKIVPSFLLVCCPSFHETRITAIENMMNAGVQGILIPANDSTAIVPPVEKARQTVGILSVMVFD